MGDVILVGCLKRPEQPFVSFDVLAAVCFYPCLNRAFRSLMTERLRELAEGGDLDVLHERDAACDRLGETYILPN